MKSAYPTRMRNREGVAEFDLEWGWAGGKLDTGFTAVLRVKNEARNLPFVLPPLLRCVVRLVLIDNGSTDNTTEIARVVAEGCGAGDRLEVLAYPFPVSRCGSEHLQTPADSVHSLSYFYNWAFSHVRTTYALKWDGDMLLTGDGERLIRDLAWQLEGERTLVSIPRRNLFVESEKLAWIDNGGPDNREIWGWPNEPGCRFDKGFEWEIHMWPDRDMRRLRLPDGTCFEVKWMDSDEFSHWTIDHDFAQSIRTVRKQREVEVYRSIQEGRPVPELIRLEDVPSEHVINWVGQLSLLDWFELRPDRTAA